MKEGSKLTEQRLVSSFFIQIVFWAAAIQCTTIALHAQVWEPAQVLYNAPMTSLSTVTTSEGTVLVPLQGVVPEQRDTIVWYDVSTIGNPEGPTAIVMLPALKTIGDVFDCNGNGLDDVVGIDHQNNVLLILDFFTENERVRPYFLPNQQHGPAIKDGKVIVDLDADGVEDFLYENQKNFGVSYGDREEPFKDRAYVFTSNDSLSDGYSYNSIACGLLGGEPYVMQAYADDDRPGDAIYQLFKLNLGDLRNRRDTIRTTPIDSYEAIQEYHYGGIVVRGQTGWWIDQAYGDIADHMLRVTVNGFERVSKPEYFKRFSSSNWFGHSDRGQFTEHTDYINASLPAACVVTLKNVDGRIRQSSIEYLDLTETPVLSTRIMGRAYLPEGAKESVTAERFLMTPDLDGDGAEDFLVNYFYFAEESDERTTRSLNLFLTGDMTNVGVEHVGGEGAIEEFRVIANSNSWTVEGAAQCVSSQQSSNLNIQLISVQGEVIGLLSAMIDGESIRIHRPSGLISGPLWTRIGDCVIRLQ